MLFWCHSDGNSGSNWTRDATFEANNYNWKKRRSHNKSSDNKSNNNNNNNSYDYRNQYISSNSCYDNSDRKNVE